jgi:hypothetical protein
MPTLSLKEELHKAIDNIQDDQYLLAIHALLVDKLSSNQWTLSEVQSAEIKRRVSEHEIGQVKGYNWTEAKKLIQNRLKS